MVTLSNNPQLARYFIADKLTKFGMTIYEKKPNKEELEIPPPSSLSEKMNILKIKLQSVDSFHKDTPQLQLFQ